MDEVRLGRIESKLEELINVVVKLATIDERQIAFNEGLKRLGGRVDDHDVRLRPLEAGNESLGWIKKIVWVIVALGVANLFQPFS